MQLDPKQLLTPSFTVEEIQRCIDVTEPGLYETGLIVDANNVMYRLAFAASKDCNDAGDMLAVFIDRIKSVVKDTCADVVICCIDSGESLRRSMLRAVKKPDKTPEQQAVVDMAREALRRLKLSTTQNCLESDSYKWLNPRWLDGYEADDLVAAFAVSGLCVHSVLYSTDSDLYQVTNGTGITQLSPATGRFLTSEVPPSFVAGVKALAGDTSDNVEGVKGIGPVTAMKILTGKQTINLAPDTELRVRHNLALTSLPLPGAFQCLRDNPPLWSAASMPSDDLTSANEAEEALPF